MLKTPTVYFHTHWDREWYQPFRAYQVRLADVVDDILDRLDRGILPCFTLDGQTVLLEDYLALRPHNRIRLKSYIETGKLAIGPWFVMPDEFLVSGESLVRNLQMGITESKAWGCQQFAGYLPDTFGHTGDMPTILRGCGIHNALLWRGAAPELVEFNWQSLNTQSVFCYHLADGYFQMMLHQADDDPDLGDTGKAGALTRLAEKLSTHALGENYLLPIGGDHLGPVTAGGVGILKKTFPHYQVSSPERFLPELQSRLSAQNIALPQVTGELMDNQSAFVLPGVWSARVYLKQSNRKLEHLLTHCWEPLGVLMQLLPDCFHKMAYPTQALSLAWRQLLLNHPHDSICGCSVDSVHRENEVRFDEVTQLATAVMNRQRHQLAATLAGNTQWLMVNTTETLYTGVLPVSVDATQAKCLHQQSDRQTVLRDDYLWDTQQVPLAHKTTARQFGWVWVEDVPPFGYRVADLKTVVNTKSLTSVTVTKNSLANEWLTLTVQDDGTLTVVDLKTKTTYSGLHQWRDTLQQGDSYNAAPVPYAVPTGAVLKRIKVKHKGPLVGMLELTYQLAKPKMTVTTTVSLSAGSALVQFESSLTNTTENHQLQVGFANDTPVTEVVAESHFSVVKRAYDPHYAIEQAMPVAAWKELKPNTGPIQRFISFGSQSLLTEGVCEYEVRDNQVYLTLLRAFGELSRADTGVRGAQAGPPLPTPEGQCLHRPLSLRYAWSPETTTEKLYALAKQFYGGAVWAKVGVATSNQPITSQSQLSWDNPAVVMTAAYGISETQWACRLLNPSQASQATTLKPAFPYQRLIETNLLHEQSQPLEEQNAEVGDLVFSLVFQPGELKTLVFQLQ